MARFLEVSVVGLKDVDGCGQGVGLGGGVGKGATNVGVGVGVGVGIGVGVGVGVGKGATNVGVGIGVGVDVGVGKGATNVGVGVGVGVPGETCDPEPQAISVNKSKHTSSISSKYFQALFEEATNYRSSMNTSESRLTEPTITPSLAISRIHQISSLSQSSMTHADLLQTELIAMYQDLPLLLAININNTWLNYQLICSSNLGNLMSQNRPSLLNNPSMDESQPLRNPSLTLRFLRADAI